MLKKMIETSITDMQQSMNRRKNFLLSIASNNTKEITITNEDNYFEKEEKSFNINSLWQIGLPDPFP
jgi:hypothetical protein